MSKTSLLCDQWAAAFIMVAACAWVLYLGLTIFPARKLSPDAGCYLDIARHLARGEGFQLKINLYASWIGPSRNALAYQQPLYPFLLSFFSSDLDLAGRALIFNTLLSVGTLIFFFLAWRTILKPWKAALAVLALASSPMLYGAYSVPLTEPMSLFFLAGALMLAMRSERWLIPAGLLLGVSLLMRASGLFGIIGLVIGIIWQTRENRLRRGVEMLICVFAPLLAFQAIGLALTGELYPGYGNDARIFRMTRDFGGALFNTQPPALRFSGEIHVDVLLKMLYYNVTAHLGQLVAAIGYVVILCSLGIFCLKPHDQHKKAWTRTIFLSAVTHLLLLSLAFYFMHPLEAQRYALPAFAVLVAVAIAGIERAAEKMRLRPPVAAWLCAAVLVVITVMNVRETARQYQTDRQLLINPDIQKTYFQEPLDWVNAGLHQHELLATNYTINAFIFDRPVISLPIDRQLTPRNLYAFFAVHRPRAVLIDRGNDLQPAWQSSEYLDLIRSFGFIKHAGNDRFILLIKNETAGLVSPVGP